MPLETSQTIDGLNALWPLSGDFKSEGDDHLRLIKDVMQKDAVSRSNPGEITGDVTVTGTLTVSDTISEGGTLLSAKYLGIADKAADADLLDGKNSNAFVQSISSDTGLIVSGTMPDVDINFDETYVVPNADKVDGLQASQFLRSDATDEFTGRLRGPSGTVASPTYSFSGDNNTGMYNVTDDTVGIVCGGTLAISIKEAQTQIKGDGTPSAPSLTFENNNTTGIYFDASNNEVRFTKLGTMNGRLESAGATANGNQTIMTKEKHNAALMSMVSALFPEKVAQLEALFAAEVLED